MPEAAINGRRVQSLLGTSKASTIIIGVEIAERMVFAAIHASLISYFTEVMKQSTSRAARNVNIWAGVSFIFPFLGAFVADSYLGCYKTIVFSSFAYLLGLGLMIISSGSSYSIGSSLKSALFFMGIYLVAVGQGGFKPCLQAFGADQFCDEDLKSKNEKSSFFNWWYFGVSIGGFLGYSVIVYIQDEFGWALGYGIPSTIMALSLVVFLSQTSIYSHKLPGGSPLTRLVHVFVATYYKWNTTTTHTNHEAAFLQEGKQTLLKNQKHHDGFRFLDKAAIADALDGEFEDGFNWRLSTAEKISEVKDVLRILIMWAACLVFGMVFAQHSTFFTKQGKTMNKKLGNFEIPAASLQCLVLVPIILLIPVYDKIFVPLARNITENKRGITLLQRIGTGMVVAIIAMIVCALVEIKRIKTASQYGLVDDPEATIPMSIFWLVPQYVLVGIVELLGMIGMQELFYEEMPAKLKSMGIAIYLSVVGMGNILSGVLISVINTISCKHKSSCWIPNNLNQGHLDYYYLFLSGVLALNFCLFLMLARRYEYKNDRDDAMHDQE